MKHLRLIICFLLFSFYAYAANSLVTQARALDVVFTYAQTGFAITLPQSKHQNELIGFFDQDYKTRYLLQFEGGIGRFYEHTKNDANPVLRNEFILAKQQVHVTLSSIGILTVAQGDLLFSFIIPSSVNKLIPVVQSSEIDDVVAHQLGFFESINQSSMIESTGPNDDFNYTTSKVYSPTGKLLSTNRGYVDGLGRPIQQLSKSSAVVDAVAVQNAYDAFGRAVLSTMPAPTGQSSIDFQQNFATVSTNQLNYTHFDKQGQAVGSLFSPMPIDASSQLGTYYSNSGSEAYQATTSYPYSRNAFFNDPLGRVKIQSQSGEHHKMGSGNETYSYYMNNGGELGYMFGRDGSYMYSGGNPMTNNRNMNVAKNVIVDSEGQTFISYKNSSDQVVATCRSGLPTNCVAQTVDQFVFEDRGAVSIHLPLSQINSLQLFFDKQLYSPTEGYAITYVIEDLFSEEILVNGVDFTISDENDLNKPWKAISFLDDTKQLFLRITITVESWYKQSNPNPYFTMVYPGRLRYAMDYSHWTVYNYNQRGQLVRMVTPKGIDCGYDVSTYAIEPFWRENLTGLGGAAQNMKNWDYNYNAENNNQFNIKLKAWYLWPFSGSTDMYALDEITQASLRTTNNNQNTIDELPSERNELEGEEDEENNANKAPVYNGPAPDDPNYLWNNTKFRVELDVALMADNNGTLTFIAQKELVYEAVLLQAQHITGSGSNYQGWLILTQSEVEFDVDNIELQGNTKLVLRSGQARFGYASAIGTYQTDMVITNMVAKNPISYSIEANGLFESIPIFQNHGSPLVESYTYHPRGWTTSYTNPDEGSITYVYDNTGKLRFSQNTAQAVAGNFSYVNYDKHNRILESGVYKPSISGSGSALVYQTHEDVAQNGIASNSVHNLLVGLNTPDIARCTEQNWLAYDLPTNDVPSSHSSAYTQTYLYGQVAKSWNANTTTWYSYDYAGQSTWLLVKDNQNILPIQTIDYTYNADFLLVSTTHNKGTVEQFIHVFNYDTDQRLEEVITRESQTSLPTRQAVYKYGQLGELKRKELATNVQGVDYVYTLHGQLKSINEYTLTNRDPGKDGFAGPNSFFHQDLYGQTYSYYQGDYIRANTHIQTYVNGPSRFDGMLASTLWKTNTPGVAAYLEETLGYRYRYDQFGQLQEAEMGVVDAGSLNGASGGNTPAFSAVNDYKVSNISYDANGNILTLKRNGFGVPDMDNLTYAYSAANNRLLALSDQTRTATYANEFEDAWGYGYDEIGQMTSYASDGLGLNYSVGYNALQKVTQVVDEATNEVQLTFAYDDRGNRFKQTTWQNGLPYNSTYYMYDASGLLVATYGYDEIVQPSHASLAEHAVYGTERIGQYIHNATPFTKYELKDQQGNVRAVVAANSTVVNFEDATGSLTPWVKRVAATTLTQTNGMLQISGAKTHGIVALFTNLQANQPLVFTLNANLTYSANGPDRITVSVLDVNNNNAQLFTQVFYPGQRITASFKPTGSRVAIHILVPNTANTLGGNFAVDDLLLWKDIAPEVLNTNDYYPFGWEMPGRSYTGAAGEHNYGYQGEYAEKLPNSPWLAFALRNYDPRLGRWLSPDPAHQYYSPYMAMGNSPVMMVDPDGAWGYYNAATGEYAWFDDIFSSSFNTEGGTWQLLSTSLLHFENIVHQNERLSIPESDSWFHSAYDEGRYGEITQYLTSPLVISAVRIADSRYHSAIVSEYFGNYVTAPGANLSLGEGARQLWIERGMSPSRARDASRAIRSPQLDRLQAEIDLYNVWSRLNFVPHEPGIEQVPIIFDVLTLGSATSIRFSLSKSLNYVDDVASVAAKGGRNIIHHLASNKHLSKYTPQFESIANKYGLKLDAAWNKVDISDVYHYSKHPSQYHEFVLKGMRAADAGAAGNQAKFLQLFDQYVKQPLLQNPNMLNKTGW